MKLLYWPQLSMRSYATGEWLLPNDSQVTKMLGWMRQLPKEWEWTWLLPTPRDWHCASYPWLPRNTRVTHIDWPPNVLTDRFGFPMNDVLEVIRSDWYDVAIIEAIEHVAGFKAAQLFSGGDLIPMVGMIGLYDDRDDPFYLRQLEGYLESDLVVFPLEVIRKRWFERVNRLIDVDVDVSKSIVVPAIFDPLEVMQAGRGVAQAHDPRVFFISRLSDDARTKGSVFVEAACQLRDEGHRFDVWLANPTDVKAPLKEGSGDLVGPPLSRSEYIELLWRADVVPILYSLEDSYSLGACEAIATGNVIVGIDGPGIVTTPDVEGVKRGIKLALSLDSGERRDVVAQQMTWLAETRSVAGHIHILKHELERMI